MKKLVKLILDFDELIQRTLEGDEEQWDYKVLIWNLVLEASISFVVDSEFRKFKHRKKSTSIFGWWIKELKAEIIGFELRTRYGCQNLV